MSFATVRNLKLPANPRGFRRETAKSVLGNSSHAHNDAGVLHRVIGIEQPRPDRAHLRPLNVLRHGVEPVAVDHFGVVVQKEQPRIVRLFDGEIIHREEHMMNQPSAVDRVFAVIAGIVMASAHIQRAFVDKWIETRGNIFERWSGLSRVFVVG